MNKLTRSIALTVLFTCATAAAEFEPEAIGGVLSLPAPYPDHWAMFHDVSFMHMSEGEILVIDPLAETLGDQYKGMMTASLIAAYQRSRSRNEHYVIESFYSRGSRGGDRTDFVTIYDAATLSVIAEIEIPAKRVSGMPKTTTTNLLANERFLAIYNFTPGQSVTIVDLKERKLVGEISTAGCGLVFANGERSFTSICSNGTLLTTLLDDAGNFVSADKSEIVFDPNQDPIFETPAVTQGMVYFPTFSGKMLPIDVSQEQIEVKKSWWLTEQEQRNWRPGGMNLVTTDSSGVGYVLMNSNGGEGTHKDGGEQVWVYDLEAGKRIGQITLTNWGLSLGTSGSGDGRLMFVTNAEMAVDVYQIPGGEYVKTLNTGAATPFLIHGAN